MTSGGDVRSFPWGTIEKTTRVEEDARCDARRWAKRHVHVEAVEGALAELLGTRVELLIRRVQPVTGAWAWDEGVAVVFASEDSPSDGDGVLVEVEDALAASVVSRAVRRAPPAIVRAGAMSSEAIAGAFAAVVMATARRTLGRVPIRVLDAGRAATLEGRMARLEPEIVAISVTVLIADEAFSARILVPTKVMTNVDRPAWDHQSLAALGDTPLALPVVACALSMTATELVELRPGDVLVLGERGLAQRADDTFVGSVLLAAPSAALAHRAELVEGGRLVLVGEVESIDAAEAEMDANERAALVATVGEVPILVRVEIGEAVMTAREWAGLARGDVVALGRRVGETVVLRVAGLPLARGELVSIGGEIGVRITERTIGQATTP